MRTPRPNKWYDRVPWWALGLGVLGLVVIASIASLLFILVLRGQGGLSGGQGIPSQTPTPSPGSLILFPTEGKPGTAISLIGQGWPAGSTIVIGLGDPASGQSPQIDPDGVLAASFVDDGGQFSVSFTYPEVGPWANLSESLIIAQAQPGGLASSGLFRVLVPSPSQTPAWTPEASLAPPTAAPTSTLAATCIDQVGFVADVTIPDNTALLSGAKFDKIWRLKNAGTCLWTTGYAVVFVDGNRMNGPQVMPLAASVGPGQTVDIKVSLTAPLTDGTYVGEWELRNDDGLLFGLGATADQPFWVKIKVGMTGSTVSGTWKGEYFNNATLKGSPKVTRSDALVSFDWGRGAPASGIPADDFSVRWTGKVELDAATYRFHVTVDDGARLYLDDQLVLDAWKEGSLREVTADVSVTKSTHTLRLEYFDHRGDATIHLAWEKLSSPSFKDWKAQYWSNRDLSGTPALVRDDRAIDFDWGSNAPAVGLPADNFSVRWTQEFHFSDGVYRFRATADDGIRVSVDGKRIIDEWHDSSGNAVFTADKALKGNHTVVVEYYERTGSAGVKVSIERLSTPTPTLTASPTPTSTATATPSETSSSTPTATSTPTPSNTPTETAEPTQTPTPTATPEAGESPVPTDIAP
jgi:hypothetical protein